MAADATEFMLPDYLKDYFSIGEIQEATMLS